MSTNICPNCGAPDFREEDGRKICQYCGGEIPTSDLEKNTSGDRRQSKKKTWLWIVVAVVLAGLLVGAYFLYDSLAGEAEPTLPEAAPEVFENAVPDFTVYDAEGKVHKLSEYFGKPIVLNLWASWCGPCKSEMPGFQEVYEAVGEDVVFLMVNVTGIDTQADAQKYIQEGGYSFPVYYDTDNSMAPNYYGGSVPMTYFIGKDGQLVTYATGAITKEILEQGIDMITE